MRENRSVFFLFLTLTILLATPSDRMSFIRAAGGQDASLRAPFSLELPDVGVTPITEPEVNIPTSNLHKLRLRVRKPYADAINYGKIYTKVNGEAAVVIQTPGRDRNDHILVTLDLDKYPRFKLRPGRNVIDSVSLTTTRRSFFSTS